MHWRYSQHESNKTILCRRVALTCFINMNKFFQITILVGMVITLQGCVAGAIVDVVAETVEAGVEITGAVVGTAVDVIVPGGDDEEKD
jgi:hypothetical protein